MLNVLKNKEFRNLFIAGSISEMGSFITDTALMMYLFALTGNQKEFMGLSKMTFMIFLTLGSVLGGPLGEKTHRRNILLWCEIMRIPAIVGIFYFKDPYTIILLNGIIAFFTGLFNPARQTMTNDLLKDGEIREANNLSTIFMAFSHLIGPFIGATLYAAFQSMNPVLSIDLFTYVLAIYLLLRIPIIKRTHSLEKESYLKSITEGFKFTIQRQDLTALFTNAIMTGFGIGVLLPMLLPFNKEVLGATDFQHGYIMTTFGVGGLLGGLLTQRLKLKNNSGKLMCIFTALEFIVYTIWNNNSNLYLAFPIIIIWGIVVFLRLPIQLSYISYTVEEKFLTRMHSFLHMAFVIPNILGTIVVAMYGDKISTVTLLNSVSITFFIIMIIRFPLKGMQALWKSEAA
jgi:MFS family permease